MARRPAVAIFIQHCAPGPNQCQSGENNKSRMFWKVRNNCQYAHSMCLYTLKIQETKIWD